MKRENGHQANKQKQQGKYAWHMTTEARALKLRTCNLGYEWGFLRLLAPHLYVHSPHQRCAQLPLPQRLPC